MADNLKMVHGEPSWDAKHNALADVVEKMGGGSKRPPMD
jgi:hypothetical protein